MSDDSEPGEIKSPDISTVVRHKRTAEEKRNYKSEKKLRYDTKDFIVYNLNIYSTFSLFMIAICLCMKLKYCIRQP